MNAVYLAVFIAGAVLLAVRDPAAFLPALLGGAKKRPRPVRHPRLLVCGVDGLSEDRGGRGRAARRREARPPAAGEAPADKGRGGARTRRRQPRGKFPRHGRRGDGRGRLGDEPSGKAEECGVRAGDVLCAQLLGAAALFHDGALPARGLRLGKPRGYRSAHFFSPPSPPPLPGALLVFIIYGRKRG